MARKAFVGGNWKCNGSMADIQRLTEMLNAGEYHDNVEVVVAPTMIHILPVMQALKVPVGVSAQNCYFEKFGAFTGELSTEILVDAGTEVRHPRPL
ncbi:Triosephosphate isomerase [Carpediemonas membranifera]|uniref:Triosephosphate isomerase n=1 Tax=Carpediemonas membranifera TaxID=201153 RepID=A0A8J6DXX0_9EUKA|nr:Triosephosphate isomerase [Carpediemonas membranifera]|eukprot:KAG9391134.1 Triosephosphate isomerase [Carpediemonas membranifera]